MINMMIHNKVDWSIGCRDDDALADDPLAIQTVSLPADCIALFGSVILLSGHVDAAVGRQELNFVALAIDNDDLACLDWLDLSDSIEVHIVDTALSSLLGDGRRVNVCKVEILGIEADDLGNLVNVKSVRAKTLDWSDDVKVVVKEVLDFGIVCFLFFQSSSQLLFRILQSLVVGVGVPEGLLESQLDLLNLFVELFFLSFQLVYPDSDLVILVIQPLQIADSLIESRCLEVDSAFGFLNRILEVGKFGLQLVEISLHSKEFCLKFVDDPLQSSDEFRVSPSDLVAFILELFQLTQGAFFQFFQGGDVPQKLVSTLISLIPLFLSLGQFLLQVIDNAVLVFNLIVGISEQDHQLAVLIVVGIDQSVLLIDSVLLAFSCPCAWTQVGQNFFSELDNGF